MKIRCLLISLILLATGAKPEITLEQLQSGGKERSYYLFVPVTVTQPAPLLVALHGSGRNGLPILQKWTSLAEEERIILAGPNALESRFWAAPQDGPNFLYDVVEAIKAKHPVDSRRIYLFGHSAGASFALLQSLMQAEYYAATAVSAGVMTEDQYPFIAYATRKIPIALWVGTRDPLVPLPMVRSTRERLQAEGVPAQLTELANHTHDYYSRADSINRAAWEFLKTKALDKDPSFRKYRF